MQSPSFLKPGDRVRIVSTARKVDPQIMAEARRLIEGWGLQVSFGAHLFAEENQFAGKDAQRLADFQAAIDSPDIKAIFCARGGYGTTRFIDRIRWDKFQQHPKWVCGFSDITALLGHINRLGLPAIHSSMPGQLDDKEGRAESFESLRRLLFGNAFQLNAEPHPFNRSGQAEGKLIGGNLSILAHLIGTASEPDYTGNILFLEDLDEYLYHIDRMLVQLKRSGRLAKLSGVVIGQFSDMRDNPIPFGKNAYEIIAEHLADYTFPLAYGFPIGHEPLNQAVPTGLPLRLEVNEQQSRLYQK